MKNNKPCFGWSGIGARAHAVSFHTLLLPAPAIPLLDSRNLQRTIYLTLPQKELFEYQFCYLKKSLKNLYLQFSKAFQGSFPLCVGFCLSLHIVTIL